MKKLKFQEKLLIGKIYMYPVNEEAKALVDKKKGVIRKPTITEGEMKTLKSMGIQFEVEKYNPETEN